MEGVRRQELLLIVAACLIAATKLSGGSLSARGEASSSQDYVSLAQKEMLFGGQDVSAPLRVKMQMLSKFAGSLAEKGAAEGKASSNTSASGAASKGVQKQALQQSGNATDAGAGGGLMAAGWDKSQWGTKDWSFWVLTGPIITLAFAFFMFYTYGVPAGILTLLVCGVIDMATYYYNW